MNLSQAELALISMGRSRLTNQFPYVSTEDRQSLDIASVRMLIAMSDALGLTQEQRISLRVVLCKLQEMYPTKAATYAVTFDVDAFLEQRSDIQRLYSKYISMYSRMSSAGYWNNAINEQIINALCQVSWRSGYPAVIYLPQLQNLIDLYAGQEAEAVAIVEAQPAQVKAKLADDLINLVGTSNEQRKRSSMEGRGRCYVCDAVKPRRTACRVCGYVPRGAS